MAEYSITFETVVSQTIKVEADDLEDAIDAAYEQTENVPFIGWNFDASGDWNPVYAFNEDTGEDTDLDSWF